NSELEQAKNDQAFLEGRIMTLEQMVKKAQVIDEKTHHDKVEIGSHVMVEAEGSKEQYVIVGSAEASPGEGRISNESPVGRAHIPRSWSRRSLRLHDRRLRPDGFTVDARAGRDGPAHGQAILRDPVSRPSRRRRLRRLPRDPFQVALRSAWRDSGIPPHARS